MIFVLTRLWEVYMSYILSNYLVFVGVRLILIKNKGNKMVLNSNLKTKQLLLLVLARLERSFLKRIQNVIKHRDTNTNVNTEEMILRFLFKFL